MLKVNNREVILKVLPFKYMNFEIFGLKYLGFLSPGIQLFLICLLFILTVLSQYREFKKTGKTLSGRFPSTTFFFFCPIYEEIIFRGFILFGLMNMYSVTYSIIISSILFGVWHLKNIFSYSKKELTLQILSTTFLLGPFMALLTVWTGTIWIAVITHYCINLFAPSTLSRLEVKLK